MKDDDDMNEVRSNGPAQSPGNATPYVKAEQSKADTGADKFRIPEPHRLPHGTSGNTGVYRTDSVERPHGVLRNNTPAPRPAIKKTFK